MYRYIVCYLDIAYTIYKIKEYVPTEVDHVLGILYRIVYTQKILFS